LVSCAIGLDLLAACSIGAQHPASTARQAPTPSPAAVV